MTQEQWYFLTAKLTAIEMLAIAIAKAQPKQSTLRDGLRGERLVLETVLLQQPSDTRLESVQKELDRLDRTLWGELGE